MFSRDAERSAGERVRPLGAAPYARSPIAPAPRRLPRERPSFTITPRETAGDRATGQRRVTRSREPERTRTRWLTTAEARESKGTGVNMKVALFITCLTDTFEPTVGIAMVRLLRHLGCTVCFPDQQTCCGQPFFNNGYHAEAARSGRRMIDVFADHDQVVCPSGSCVSMVKHHTPSLLADDPHYGPAAQQLADKTWEVGQFLTDVLGVEPSNLTDRSRTPTTFHYSCHLRGLQTPDQAARLVGEIRDLDYRPLERMDQCCGFGGAFSTLYPDISQAMVNDKLDCIARTGATRVICNEAGCGMTLQSAARRRNLNLQFWHVAQLWAACLGLTDV